MSEQYFASSPQSSHDMKTLNLVFEGCVFRFYTDAGVFSRDDLDKGTALLLRYTLPHLSGKVLDLGCGWGAVGVIIAKLKPQCRVTMLDINERAVNLARKNLEHNRVQARVFCADGLEQANEHFDWILLNPPIRAGKQTVYRLFEESAGRLSAGGTLALVIRKQQGALSARVYLETLFDSVSLIARKSGYHIYFCRRGEHEV